MKAYHRNFGSGQPVLSAWIRIGMAISLSATLFAVSACGSPTQPSDVVDGAQSDLSGSVDTGGEVVDTGDDSANQDAGEDSSEDAVSASADDALSTEYEGDYTLSIGSGAADENDIAKSDKWESSQSSSTLQCDSGHFMLGVEIEYSTWGTYPSITYVRITCAGPDGATETKSKGTFGGGVGTLFSVGCAGTMTYGYSSYQYDNGDFMTGIKLKYDNYIKDMKAGCSDLTVNESSGFLGSTKYTPELSSRVYNMGYGSDLWALGRLDYNDSEREIDCDGTDEVLSGLKLQYKKDSNEYAFTSVQPICSKLTATANSPSPGLILGIPKVQIGTLSL